MFTGLFSTRKRIDHIDKLNIIEIDIEIIIKNAFEEAKTYIQWFI